LRFTFRFSAAQHAIATAPSHARRRSRKRELFCCACEKELLRGCSAENVFDFFHCTGLAAFAYRHHCLTALRSDDASCGGSDVFFIVAGQARREDVRTKPHENLEFAGVLRIRIPQRCSRQSAADFGFGTPVSFANGR
jgi:hypothetical protein